MSALAGPPKASFLARIRAGEMGGVILTHSWTPAEFAAATAKLHAPAARSAGRCSSSSTRRAARAGSPGPRRGTRRLSSAGSAHAQTEREATAAAAALRDAGVDVDLAPVADTLGPGGFLGDVAVVRRRRRVVGRSPPRSSSVQAGGVAATAKHFPGLGAARQLDRRRARLGRRRRRSRPFRKRDRRRREARDGLERVVPEARPERERRPCSRTRSSAACCAARSASAAGRHRCAERAGPVRTPDAPGRALAAGADLLLYTSGSAAHYGYEELAADAQRSAATRASSPARARTSARSALARRAGLGEQLEPEPLERRLVAAPARPHLDEELEEDRVAEQRLDLGARARRRCP